ncbi:protein of unknown function [Tenacibaculum sp. MAR_2009_124]|uniref:DUF4369 domain-containing protein n=1 Tax=Tenacibaculum sp. MAR_2009_124 TaxID=1250059 RepID=UPI00089D9A48|nr:DUF4369 domain-containing protein [Tenacibaculum sp. MAR_2009_124]SEB75201.1 protein of unknown function [Tenacibaculum sp. MAR_2009_124]
MKKVLATFITAFLIIACSSKKEGNMIVKGQIKGLKKGTLYLQKMKDTVIVTVDSVALLGSDTFILSDNVESPEMYYLTFNGNTNDKRLLFFGEKGEISITDKLEEFGFRPEIIGSQNQIVMNKFREVDQRFNNQRLELIKKEFEARKENDELLLDDVNKEKNKIIRRRFLFATNFAIANANSEAAPYIALTELYDANIKLLDTINNSLSDKVKSSGYGKKLQNFIEKIKNDEK